VDRSCDGAWNKERRRQARADIAMPAEYRILTRSRLGARASGRGLPVAAQVKNLSAGGALLLVWERLLQYSVLSVLLQLPGYPEPVRSLAEVRHRQDLLHGATHPYAVGLEFLSISNHDTSRVAHFVQNAKLS
jgi:hypothetical protein